MSRNHGLVLFNPYIGPLPGANPPGQSRPGSDGNKGILCILQSITGTSPSDYFVHYPGHSLGGYSFAGKKQSVYSTAPTDRAYTVIHRQTVSFYQNSSVWLDMRDAGSRDRNPSNFTLD